MWKEIKKSIQKKEIYYFIILIIVFTGVTTTVMVSALMKNNHEFCYTFVPDFKINQVVFRDRIDSEKKLQAVLHDVRINKEFNPKIGDFITRKEGQLLLFVGDEILRRFDVYPLKKVLNYIGEDYQFIPNTITISKNPMLVEKVKTEVLIDKIRNNKNITVIGLTNLQLGAFIWKSPQGYYHIFRDNNFSKKHLYNPKLHELVNIKEVMIQNQIIHK